MNWADPKMICFMHLAVSWVLVGLIWMVQVVHYPLFSWVPEDTFPDFSRAHGAAITPLVGPLMVIELLLAILHWLKQIDAWPIIVALALVLFIWVVTFFVSVPLHEKLGLGFSTENHRSLVLTNWLRTIAWTFKACLLSWYFLRIHG